MLRVSEIITFFHLKLISNGKVEELDSTDCDPPCGDETSHIENDFCDGYSEWNPWDEWRKGLQ